MDERIRYRRGNHTAFQSTVEACASGSDRHSLDVLANCIEASKKYNIAIMVEYDLSGLGSDSDLDMLIRDWDMLNENSI